MSQESEALRKYFAKLQFAPEMADVYITLLTYGPQAISELSRRSGVERTRIYRLLEDMIKSTLIEVESHYRRNIYKAAPIGNLQIQLTKKEEELRELQREFEKLERSLERQSIQGPSTAVQFYHGLDGIKQMFWNQTKAQGETVAILYENSQNRTNSSFFERWVRECNQRDLKFRGIIGDHFIESQKAWYGRKDNERLKNWESRYVGEAVHPINHSSTVYDDVTCYHLWRGGDVFGIEIHNPEIADDYRHFFAMLWEKAEPISKEISQQLKK